MSSAGPAGCPVGVLALLVDRQADVPAPEREDRSGQPGDERAELEAGERVQPVELERGVGRRAGGADERHDHEQREHEHLEGDQDDLHAHGGGDAAVGDVGRDRHERQAGDDVDDLVAGQLGDRLVPGEARDEQVEERDRDAGQVGQHDHRGDDQPPAAQPAHVGAERLRRPGEGRATVRRDLVELAVGVCGEQHRDEARDEDRRHLQARLRARPGRAWRSACRPGRPTRCRASPRRTGLPLRARDPCP